MHSAEFAGGRCAIVWRRRAAMPSTSEITSQLSSTLPTLPQEDVAHFVDVANRPENANMTPEQKLNLMTADPQIAQLLARLQQQIQSGGVNLGANNTIEKIDDVMAGDKVNGDKFAGDQITINIGSEKSLDPQTLKLLKEFAGAFAAPPPQPPAPAAPRDVAIDRYVRHFSDVLKNPTPQGPKYDFPLTFQLISDTGEPIEASAGTPIDQLITWAQNSISRKVILRGAAGSGKTTAMQRTAALI